MTNILFIAYDYPPILSPEAIQVQRRALTLANNGHRVIVLTVHQKPAFEFIDKELSIEHFNIKVFHTKAPCFEKILNSFYKFFDITDRKYWWKSYALKEAIKLINTYNIDTIYTHSTPLVDHIVGLKIKQSMPTIKWIAHFSDPWTLNPYKDYKFKWQFNLNRKLEVRVCDTCDMLTVTSKKTKEKYLNKSQKNHEKVYILPHTFDASYFKTKAHITDKKIVVHTGNIYGLRTITYFLQALKEVNITNVEFHFYGKIKESEVELIDNLGLNQVVKVYSQIPYLESLKKISKANYLMVIDAPLKDSPFFPSKLADYIGAKKPIIALTPEKSTTRDILKYVNNDLLMANSNSVKEIKDVLLKLSIETINLQNIDYYSMENYELLKDVFEK